MAQSIQLLSDPIGIEKSRHVFTCTEEIRFKTIAPNLQSFILILILNNIILQKKRKCIFSCFLIEYLVFILGDL